MTEAGTAPDTHDPKPLLVVKHVPWEGPHVILNSFPDVPILMRSTLDGPAGTPLPDPATVRGAVFMGGPMSVNDADTLPGLAEEIAWLQQAVALEVPVLGVCLGAQLLAKAAGASITAAPQVEIGVLPITITDPDDALLAQLGPDAHAMHWHGEQFTLPQGAVTLAHSAQTAVQAFRLGTSAWGMLFHLEVDDALLDIWLAEPTMAAEAESALGAGYREQLSDGLTHLCGTRAQAVFDQFAETCAQRHLAPTALTGGSV